MELILITEVPCSLLQCNAHQMIGDLSSQLAHNDLIAEIPGIEPIQTAICGLGWYLGE